MDKFYSTCTVLTYNFVNSLRLLLWQIPSSSSNPLKPPCWNLSATKFVCNRKILLGLLVSLIVSLNISGLQMLTILSCPHQNVAIGWWPLLCKWRRYWCKLPCLLSSSKSPFLYSNNQRMYMVTIICDRACKNQPCECKLHWVIF